jgi:hypothetical protein
VEEAAETVLLGRRENSYDLAYSSGSEGARNRVRERVDLYPLQAPLPGLDLLLVSLIPFVIRHAHRERIMRLELQTTIAS